MRLKAQQYFGFTLAELLIALAILGVIATFTIPKILDSGSSSQKHAIAMEFASMMSGAFEAYKLNNTVTGNTSIQDLTPYMNYVAIDTSSTTVDYVPTLTSLDCPSPRYCLRLHNGSVAVTRNDSSFGSTDLTSAIHFYIDPDGSYSGQTTGPGKSVCFFLYTNGRLTTYGNILPNTYIYYGGGPHLMTPTPAFDPEWLEW